jgi:hypothetical protein
MFLSVPLLSFSAVFAPADIVDGSFVAVINSEDYEDLPLTDCLSDDGGFGTHSQLFRDYLQIVEAYITNSDDFESYISTSYESKKYAADAWGRIDSTVTPSNVKIRRLYQYGFNYFIILVVNGEVTFTNVRYEENQLMLTNEIKRDGAVSDLINFIEFDCQKLELRSFSERINNIVPLFNTEAKLSGLDGLLSHPSGVEVPFIAFETQPIPANVSLSDAMTATYLPREVKSAVGELHAASIVVIQEDNSLFPSFWVKDERKRVSDWIEGDRLNATLKNQYGFSPDIEVLSIITIGANLNIIYLDGGLRVVYMMKESGEWRIADRTVYTGSFRSMMESDSILKYLKFRQNALDAPPIDFLNQYLSK